ncbi:MAG: manganese-binding transcriptional regulator MntR [Dehalococcoidia bacterium]
MGTKESRVRKKTPRKPTPSPAAQARAARRADGFRATRQRSAAGTAEDYVELIDDLIKERGEARSVEMAARLGVSHVTVAKTIQRLQREGLVRTEPYRSIFLTERGLDLAETCRDRHRLVVGFLRAIGVSKHASEIDAEGIEHHVSAETLQAMREFVSDQSGSSPRHRGKK